MDVKIKDNFICIKDKKGTTIKVELAGKDVFLNIDVSNENIRHHFVFEDNGKIRSIDQFDRDK